MADRLTGKRALVTAAAQGIGRATARAFAALEDTAVMDESGAIEQDVHGAEIGGDGEHGIIVGDIEEAGIDTGHAVQFSELVPIHVGGENLRAFSGESPRRGTANPLRGCGHQRPLSGQSVGHCSSRSVRRPRVIRGPSYRGGSMGIGSHVAQAMSDFPRGRPGAGQP